MSVNKDMNDLPNEILCIIFEFLPTKQLFQLEVVNEQWQKCARQVIGKQMTSLARHNYSDKKIFILNSTLFVPYLLDDNLLTHLMKILIKLPNIKTLNLRDSFSYFGTAYGKYDLALFANLLPELEQICFYTKTTEARKELFDCFNSFISFKNLKKLKWNGHCAAEITDQNMIHVLQRMNHLNIELCHFVELKDPLENLVELKIEGTSTNQMNAMTFPNLKKLWLKITNTTINSIAKLNFPQLEFVDIDYDFPYDCRLLINKHLNRRFFNQIKNIKTLHCEDIQFEDGNLISLKNLTKFKSVSYDYYPRTMIIDMIYEMIKLDSLQNINLIHYVKCSPFCTCLLDNLINLSQTKPNAKIEMKIAFDALKEYEQQTLNEYMNNFAANNWKILDYLVFSNCSILTIRLN